jgi:hypothetical protein
LPSLSMNEGYEKAVAELVVELFCEEASLEVSVDMRISVSELRFGLLH